MGESGGDQHYFPSAQGRHIVTHVISADEHSLCLLACLLAHTLYVTGSYVKSSLHPGADTLTAKSVVRTGPGASNTHALDTRLGVDFLGLHKVLGMNFRMNSWQM